jgi:hypothetical protein
MALQNQTYANSGSPYYGHPADWSNYSTLNDVIRFNDTNATIRVIPAVPDSDTTITFNNEQLAYVSDIPDLANWAQYPANANVVIPSPYELRAETAFISTLTVYTQVTENEVNISTFTASTVNISKIANIVSTVTDNLTTPLINNSTIFITANHPNILNVPELDITSRGGSGGIINLSAQSGNLGVGGGLITLASSGGSGLAGLNGAIDIIADSGSSAVVGVTTGGRIDITANSGLNDVSLTSAVKVSAAGVNIQSGITSPITSVAGYTFIGGNLGVNSCAGIPAIIPNVPGTNYMYGTNGIVLNSDVYTSDVYPYFSGLVNPPDLNIHGRTVDIGFGAYNAMVGLSNVKDVAFESSGLRTGGAITGLSSINGQRYLGSYDPTLQLSTLTMNPGFNGIFNHSYVNPTGNNNDMTFSQEGGTGELNINMGFPKRGNIKIANDGVIVLNGITTTGLTLDVSGALLTFPAPITPIGQIVNVSTINGAQYPPPGITFFVASNQLYVAPNGDDIIGNGSQENPFATIGRAFTARLLLSPTVEVSIVLSSGTYTENLVIPGNTFLVGVPVGEVRQPCNIVGTINAGNVTGGIPVNIGLSHLEINGAITLAGTGGQFIYTIFGCNMTDSLVDVLTCNTGSLFVTESRIFGQGGRCIRSSAGNITVRNCILTQNSANSCIETEFGLILRESFLTGGSSSIAQPLIKFTGFGNVSSEISFCKLVYGSGTIDTGTNKCCVQFNRTSDSMSMTMFSCLLQAPGARFPTLGPFECIQNRGAGTVTLNFAQLSATPGVSAIAPSITKSAFTTVT